MIDVLGDWTSGEGMVPSIIMEVLFHRVEGDDPWLMEVCVNYTNSFPYRDELEEDLHISASMNCDITPIGLEMNEGADDAWAILGPIEFEGSRPEHLSVLGSFLGGKNRISAEVLDTEWEIIPGFELSRSTVVTEEDVQSFIKWEDLNLYDLPLTLDMIYIRLRMEKETSVEPAIKWVELGGSTDPSIIGSSIDRAWINRGENTIIGIEVADLEDPSEGLSVELEYTAPGSDTWESALLTEGLWVEGMWSFDIFTGMETVKGEYTFRARATDGVGMVSDWTDLEISLEVRNNLPDAPMICVEPGVARVGDDIEISTIWEGEDLERSSGELTYTLVLYNDGVEHSSYDNITTPDMIIEGLTFEKHQNWTITVTTWDGENTSEPFVTWFLVENTEPVTTGQLPGSLTMLEDTPLLLDDVGSWFFDADGDALDHSFETIEEIEISIDDDGVLLTPMTDHHGEGYLLIDLWDDEIVLSVNISLTIRSVNDAPLYNDISTVKVMQDKWTYVDIGSRDPSDGEVLLFSSDITDIIPGAVEGENLFFYPNGSFRLKTDNDMVGTHNITYRIEDEEHTIIDHVQIEVIDVNDAPSIISADTLSSNTVYLAGENIALLASASDPDEQWG
ncbi:MAG: hypothetical protein U9R75_10440, partial [Candidatus Thermoplasmatota archaeon]|nr:hypothetical protein [Candidatus Thermoplasmatota archaeon]